jgi:adenylylsulfate kinase
MKEGGINASEGANALKSGLASIINPTKQTTEVMNNFGIDIQGLVNKNAGDLVGTVQALQIALSKLDPLSKSKAIEQLFGKFQFARMSALFDNLGASGSQTLQVMDLMKASTVELANVADRELSVLTESASGKFARQLESFKANMAGVGEGFLGIFSGVLGVLNKLLDGFNRLPDGIKNIMTILGVVIGLAGPLIMLSGVFLNFFGYLTKAVGFMGRLFTGTKGFELLNEKIMANKLSTDSMSNSFYDQARATEVARMEIDRLIRSMTELMAVQETASTGAAIAGGSGKFAPQAMFQSRGGFMPGGSEFSHYVNETGRKRMSTDLGISSKDVGNLGTLGTYVAQSSPAAALQRAMGEAMPTTIASAGTSEDDLRRIINNKDYSEQGRRTNIGQAIAIAKYLDDANYDVIVSLVSPYKDLREELKASTDVIEIYVHTTDIRGREAFHVSNYEPPTENFIDIDTTGVDVFTSLNELLTKLEPLL